MIKRPILRVPCIADVAPEGLDELERDLRWAFSPLSFPVKDFEPYGSAARNEWQLHSDLDFNVVTGLTRKDTLALWRGDKPAAREVIRRVRALSNKWGVRLLFRFEYPQGVKYLPFYSCFSLADRVHYHPEATQRVDVDPVTGAVTPRLARPQVKPQQFNFSWLDEDANQHINEEQWPEEEVERCARLYRDKFQRIGATPDTLHLAP